MKAGREHKIALPKRAIEILRGLKRHSAHPFPLSNMAMLELLRGLRPGHTTHGFRSTFRDWAGDRTRYDRETIEFALAHGIGDRTEAAYRRGDAMEKRRRLLEAWSEYLATPGPKDASVTPMRARAHHG